MHDRLRRLLTTADSPPPALLAGLGELGFTEPAAIARRVRELLAATDGPEARECLVKLLAGLQDTPAPEATLTAFERLMARTADRAVMYRSLHERPRAIDILLKVFVGSQYLTETLLRSPDALIPLTQHRELADLKSREEFYLAALDAAQAAPNPAAQLDALRQYQRWEILRIGVCDNVGLMDLRAATNQLSLLADGLIQACLHLAAEGAATDRGFAVLGLGKLGGEELNYSSDIDLIFLSDHRPERWIPIAQRLIRALQNATPEGFLYRVDLRLRPWGRSGALISSASAFLDYLHRDAALWERQALLKARFIAGDPKLAATTLDDCQPLLFGDDPAAVRRSVQEAKQRIEADLARRGRGWGEVKLGTGSIRDIEFLTQYLQLLNGGPLPQLRTPNTLDALIRLTDAGLLHADEYRHLTSGYQFLRTVEHALQLMHNKQVHQLPTDVRELGLLARRLDFPGGEAFVAHYDRHCQAIRKIYDRHLGAESPATDRTVAVTGPRTAKDPLLVPFTDAEREQHVRWLRELTRDRPVAVRPESLGESRWRVTVVGIDQPGDLSMICGLLFVYGFDIVAGTVTSGEHPKLWAELERAGLKPPRATGAVRDFVDVFVIESPWEIAEPANAWQRYEADLRDLLLRLRDRPEADAQGRLAKRVAAALEGAAEGPLKLSPMEVGIDNQRSARGTVLEIRGDDSQGFLYELTNALTLCGIDIQQVDIRSEGQRVSDTLLVTDAQHGGKLSDPVRIEQLKVAVVLIKHFTHLLPKSPNPEASLLHFRTFVGDMFRRPNWFEELASLDRPDVLDALAQLLGVSDFLWEDFLRLQHANIFPLLHDLTTIQDRKPHAALARELAAELKSATEAADRIARLNAFKDREMFRVDMRHILGRIARFDEFSEELSDIAEVVVAAALELATAELTTRHGRPRSTSGGPATLSVCALGKCGGRELGFASDIELLFVYSSEGTTTGPEVIPNSTFFPRIVERFTQAIQARREGIFQVDLRLRPYGRAGQLAVSVPAFQQYFGPDGPAWPYERQALVKLRPVAGNEALGRKIVALRDQLIYTPRAFDAAPLRAMRERQVRQLVRAGTFHAKLSPGGLVDLEYLVQALQLSHGLRHPELRTTNTLRAAGALKDAGVFSADEHTRFVAAYGFFRRLIDALRMVRGDARDLTVPSSRSEEFEFLARRLGHSGQPSRLKAELEQYSQQVVDLVRNHLPTDSASGPVIDEPAISEPLRE
jgi:glutamate-ammonia-ligase adenylyltransferase